MSAGGRQAAREPDDGADDPLRQLVSALDRVTRPPLLTAVAALLLALLALVSTAHLLQLSPPRGGNIEIGTGDFLAFWTGASILHGGDGSRLYDLATQQHWQALVLGGESASLQPYLNPPLLAALLAPLVPLGYLPAFYLYDAACLAALGAGLAMLLGVLPAVAATRRGAWTLVLVVASYQPMLQTTVGGQNTPITFALLAAFALAMQRGAWTWAAVAVGLLSYKPQYAVGLSVALLLAGHWRIVAGAAPFGIAHWGLGAWSGGPWWPLAMMELLGRYRPSEIAQNGSDHFSWTRVSDLLLPEPMSGVAALAGTAAVLALWWRHRDRGREGDPRWTALVVTGTMFCSPHLQYYDVALLALPLAVVVDRHLVATGSVGLAVRLGLALVHVGYPAWQWSAGLGVQPLFFVLVAALAWTLAALRLEAPGPSGGGLPGRSP